MKAVIAEKPSVARELARILGASERRDGYLEGNGYLVTWAFGHLVQIHSDLSDGKWTRERLPILPPEFTLRPVQRKDKKGKAVEDAGVGKQLKTIDSVFRRCDEIIVATDAGREGELIFRYIYSYLGADIPFRRLWISSLTDNAIRDGLRDLRPGSEFDDLYASAKARSEADWIVGINATQALTLAAGSGLLSLGRVQTPTLAMICSRYQEHRDFVPQPFWTLSCPTAFHRHELTVKGTKRYLVRSEAEDDREKAARAKLMRVTSVTRKERRTLAPLLHDLTSLQKEANRRHSLTAEKTLAAAQSLYEKKLLTYPRTGSRYITEDVFATIPSLLSGLKGDPRLAPHVADILRLKPNRRCVDEGKVTDHHALLVTENRPGEDLAQNELKIYHLVAERMCEAFLGTCVEDVTKVLLDAGGVEFSIAGSVPLVPGWKAVRGLENHKEDRNDLDEDEERQGHLPPLKENDILPVRTVSIDEGQTKPRPIHTEASLLAAMETAGKDAEEEEIREALKDTGLGTPATRASIIETLLQREYVVRDGKKLVPTNLGMTVYGLVREKAIADAHTTGQWEMQLNRIARGEADAGTFGSRIRDFAAATADELLRSDAGRAVREAVETDSRGPACPKCGKEMKVWPKNVRCPGCGLNLWTEICGKKLPDKAVRDLLEKGVTGNIFGFVSKAGRKFSARLRLDGEYKAQFEFDDKKKK